MNEFLAAGPAPLADVRIVSVEQYGAGPWGTMQLSDLGAEVIKIEDPAAGGDVARYVPPFQEDESSLFFEAFNRGKRSVSLDLKTDAGRAAFEDLVRCSDAVFSNLRGDQPDRLRLRYRRPAGRQSGDRLLLAVRVRNDRATGERRRVRLHDPGPCRLAERSPATRTAHRSRAPCRSWISAAATSPHSQSSPVCGAPGATAAAPTSTFRCSRSRSRSSTTSARGSPRAGTNPCAGATRRISRSSRSRTFATADGWLVVACPKQSLWEQLCTAIERPDLAAADGQYATFAERGRNRDALLAELETVFAARTTAEWLEALVPARVSLAHPSRASRTRWTTPRSHARAGLVETTSTPFWGAYPRRQARSSSTVSARRRGQGRLVARTPPSSSAACAATTTSGSRVWPTRVRSGAYRFPR